jgi:hydroxymethylpyrimidine pyrophosphatase-like HAD family hydrolase
LKRLFRRIDIFDRVVAENGALIYDPQTEEERTIAPAPPEDFVAALRNRGVEPLSVGRAIVATWEPNETTVLEVIRDLGLELEIIFNKGARDGAPDRSEQSRRLAGRAPGARAVRA